MRFLYDPKLKRPGCVLLQAVYGCDRRVVNRFHPNLWLVAPTKDMAVFDLPEDKIEQLVKISEEANPKLRGINVDR